MDGSRTINNPDVLPEYRMDAASLQPDSLTSTSMVSGASIVRTPSSRSSQSVPDLELQQDIGMVQKLEEQLTCPGAFSILRNGSTKSVVSIEV
jgi:hypothetical protein